MHLVWTTGRIFLKPIPRFLLEPRFWSRYFSCEQVCRYPTIAHVGDAPNKCPLGPAGKRALGFLFSYAALISHESDFFIAKERHLIPEEAEWSGWRIFVEQLDTEHIYPKIDARFVYGELRLGRLNKIYILSRRPFLRGYMAHWNQYGTFFRDNFVWLASATVYIAIVLTAMRRRPGTAPCCLARQEGQSRRWRRRWCRGTVILSCLGGGAESMAATAAASGDCSMLSCLGGGAEAVVGDCFACNIRGAKT